MPRSVVLTTLVDAGCLAMGAFTMLPVPAPRSLSSRVLATAVLLAPVAVVPVALFAAAVAVLAQGLGLGGFAAALLAVLILTVLTGQIQVARRGRTEPTEDDAQPARQLVLRMDDVSPAHLSGLVCSMAIQVGALAGIWAHDDAAALLWLVLSLPLGHTVLAVGCHNLSAASPADPFARAVARRVPLHGLVVPAALLLAAALFGALAGLSVIAVVVGELVGAAAATAAVTITRSRAGGLTSGVLLAASQAALTGLLLGYSAAR